MSYGADDIDDDDEVIEDGKETEVAEPKQPKTDDESPDRPEVSKFTTPPPQSHLESHKGKTTITPQKLQMVRVTENTSILQ